MKKVCFIFALMATIFFTSRLMAGYDCENVCIESIEVEDEYVCMTEGYSCTDTNSGITIDVDGDFGCSGTTCIGVNQNGKVMAKVEFDSNEPNTAQITEYNSSGNIKSTTSVTYDHNITDYEDFGNVDDKRGDFYYDEEGLTQRNTTTYASDGITPTEKTSQTYNNGVLEKTEITTYEDEDNYTVKTQLGDQISFTLTEYENGIAVSKKEYMEECDPNFPCENGNCVLAEYELDAEGHVTAVWKNVAIREEHHDCSMECMGEWDEEADACAEEEEEICEDWDEVTGYNREKYAADGKTKLALYDSDGELIEAYQEETPQGAKELKRIYTVEEAAKLVKPTGNTFKIRYK